MTQFTVPGSDGSPRTITVTPGRVGRQWLKCDCAGARFSWKGGTFVPCKHVRIVLETKGIRIDQAGNIISGRLAEGPVYSAPVPYAPASPLGEGNAPLRVEPQRLPDVSKPRITTDVATGEVPEILRAFAALYDEVP